MKQCPLCEKHCSIENLSCPQGRMHFHKGNAQKQDKMIVLLRKCGHFLHHNFAHDKDTSLLTKALNEEEKKTLESLLEKCLNHWQNSLNK